MADEIDIANEQSERWLNQALAARSSGPKLAAKGSCHYCETEFDSKDPAKDKKLFCDSDCAADYEHEQKLKARK